MISTVYYFIIIYGTHVLLQSYEQYIFLYSFKLVAHKHDKCGLTLLKSFCTISYLIWKCVYNYFLKSLLYSNDNDVSRFLFFFPRILIFFLQFINNWYSTFVIRYSIVKFKHFCFKFNGVDPNENYFVSFKVHPHLFIAVLYSIEYLIPIWIEMIQHCCSCNFINKLQVA